MNGPIRDGTVMPLRRIGTGREGLVRSRRSGAVSSPTLVTSQPVKFVLASSAAFAAGGAFTKSAGGFTRLWPSAAVAMFLLVGAVLLTRAVQHSGLATAYTVGLGVEAVLVVTVGVGLFGERPSPTRLIGIGFIVLGVAGVRIG